MPAGSVLPSQGLATGMREAGKFRKSPARLSVEIVSVVVVVANIVVVVVLVVVVVVVVVVGNIRVVVVVEVVTGRSGKDCASAAGMTGDKASNNSNRFFIMLLSTRQQLRCHAVFRVTQITSSDPDPKFK